MSNSVNLNKFDDIEIRYILDHASSVESFLYKRQIQRELDKRTIQRGHYYIHKCGDDTDLYAINNILSDGNVYYDIITKIWSDEGMDVYCIHKNNNAPISWFNTMQLTEVSENFYNDITKRIIQISELNSEIEELLKAKYNE